MPVSHELIPVSTLVARPTPLFELVNTIGTQVFEYKWSFPVIGLIVGTVLLARNRTEDIGLMSIFSPTLDENGGKEDSTLEQEDLQQDYDDRQQISELITDDVRILQLLVANDKKWVRERSSTRPVGRSQK